jgi:hypothetical protein
LFPGRSLLFQLVNLFTIRQSKTGRLECAVYIG